MKSIKVGIDAFNDLAKSHDAHVKEVERLQEKVQALYKYNNGKGALLCSGCRIILKEGTEIVPLDFSEKEAQYCNKCEDTVLGADEDKRTMKNDIDIDEIWYILRKYDIDQDILREILYKLYDNMKIL